MKNVLYGCACALLLALTWTVLDVRIAVLRASTDLGMVAANSDALMRQMASTTQEQGLYWRATSLQTSRLIGQARHTMDSVNDAVKSVDESAASLNQLVKNTDVSLNAKNGVLPQLSESSKAIGVSAIELSAHATPAFDEATEALHATARTGNAAAIFVEQATPGAVRTINHVDQVTEHVAHVADHYDATLTAEQTKWEKFKSNAWVFVRIAVRAF